jgi:hypothetical protein
MKSMQPAPPNPSFDPVQAKPQPLKLPPGNNPKLPTGQLGNSSIQRPSLLRTVCLTADSRLGGHGSMVSPAASRVVRGV